MEELYRVKQIELVKAIPNTELVISDMMQHGIPHDTAVGNLTGTIHHLSMLLSMLEMFGIIAVVIVLAPCLHLLAPRVKGGHY